MMLMSSPSSQDTAVSRKRSRDEIDFSSPTKKLQQHQIHTEVHIHTVNSLMEASRRQKQLPKIQDDEEEPDTDTDCHLRNYHQKPFWPALQSARR
ncbi:hypothetical protein QG37_04485 [Candidozyma auris]|nr:hypothetical protein QG37_04485 [[Candida] auris]